MRTVAIVQARLASQRLPGKVMLDIVGKPMLQHVLERVAKADGIDLIVTATPDMEICAAVESWDIGCAYMADCDEDDVFSRYHLTAQQWEADVVVRITGDCPLVDPRVITAVIATHNQCNVLFTTNAPYYPDGLDVEVISTSLLRRLREHVTAFPTNVDTAVLGAYKPVDGEWISAHKICPCKLSVDTQDDLDFVRWIYERIGKDIFGLDEITELLKRDSDEHDGAFFNQYR